MTALVIAIFLASVLGSLHCVGMCGAFLALAFTDVPAVGRWRLSVAYHGGRLITYTTLGVAAGTAGSLLDLTGTLAGINRVALPLAGVTVVGFGILQYMRLRGITFGRLQLPRWWVASVSRLQGVAMSLDPIRRALAIGLLTTLLPCGWLYAFIVTAAGTADPLVGGIVMVVFWSGTLPTMVACGIGVQSLAGPFGRKLPGVTCLVLIAMGLWTVLGRGAIDTAALAQTATDSTAVDELNVPDPGNFHTPGQTPACHATPTFDSDTGLIIEHPADRCGNPFAGSNRVPATTATP